MSSIRHRLWPARQTVWFAAAAAAAAALVLLACHFSLNGEEKSSSELSKDKEKSRGSLCTFFLSFFLLSFFSFQTS